ncbi:MAG: hypothetical protein M1433_00510 [Candidatus Parvarchaeota archaeon]|nr:hypothetical protein [Candidatus Parvarchaeota archaeon]
MHTKGITETTIYYIIALALSIVLIIIYILLAGPSVITNAISGFFSGFKSSIISGLGRV